MPNDKYRELAVKLHNLKIIEGLDSVSICLPAPPRKVQQDEIPRTVHIELVGDNLSIYLTEKSKSKYGHGGATNAGGIYNGPIVWLKGVIDYDKPPDEQ